MVNAHELHMFFVPEGEQDGLPGSNQNRIRDPIIPNPKDSDTFDLETDLLLSQ